MPRHEILACIDCLHRVIMFKIAPLYTMLAAKKVNCAGIGKSVLQKCTMAGKAIYHVLFHSACNSAGVWLCSAGILSAGLYGTAEVRSEPGSSVRTVRKWQGRNGAM